MNPIEKQLICPKLKLFLKGKVREVYDFDDKLLIVATDQISAFDVVLPSVIKGKGEILNKISNFWFGHFSKTVKNHLISTDVKNFPSECQEYKTQLEGRSVLVLKTQMVQFESIVRGYLSGSGYKDYLKTGAVCGIELPKGLLDSAKLEKPIFTPSTKAHQGHDINISEKELKTQVDSGLVDKIKNVSLDIYSKAHKFALGKGIIIADTKFEFGILNGEIILIDEILTPDSSRFWPADEYVPGKTQNSFDKQIIRNYLEGLNWDKKYPGPALPQEVIDKTIVRYSELYNKIVEPA
ncbi:MAG: phosphoribosylaminoimidazolesuccinocarboxamide synthase [Deltaproteobacteria bacterium]|nr:phosphoribosylaminoimidazolesuccinocarboxamide synthase [Deltaproteobacteria bacterium]